MQTLVVHAVLVMAKAHLRCEGKEKETKNSREQMNRGQQLSDKVEQKKPKCWNGDELQMQCVVMLFWFVILRTTKAACCLNK